MILMDELNDTFGEVQFNRSESAWIYQRQSCQKKFLPFYVEVIIGFCKGEPTKNCQGLQSLGLCHKINHCTGCHDTCQSIQVTTVRKEQGGDRGPQPWEGLPSARLCRAAHTDLTKENSGVWGRTPACGAQKTKAEASLPQQWSIKQVGWGRISIQVWTWVELKNQVSIA